jgi:uncharacterized tellurite resistance protein B-like protein
MIIFGTTSTRKLLSSGRFHCPQCDAETPYEKRRAKRWGHLYWIPIVPMEEMPPYVECQKCRATFVDRVLDRQRAAHEARTEFERAASVLLGKMALADGSIADEEIVTIRAVLKKLTGREIEAETVAALIAEARNDTRAVEEIASSLTATLNSNGVELVVRACLMVAAADGHVDKTETEMLSRVARGLGMSSAHFRGVVDEVYGTVH